MPSASTVGCTWAKLWATMNMNASDRSGFTVVSSRPPLRGTVVLKTRHAPVKGIHNIDAIVVVDIKSGRQLKLFGPGSLPPEVIQQLPLLVEDLHHTPLSVDDVKMRFGIKSDSLRPKHPSRAVPNFSDRVAERARAIEDLHAEIHGIHHRQILPMQPQLRGEVKLAVAGARFSDRLQHVPLHIHHENLVAQRVGHINALRHGIHRNARGALEVSFAAFQASNHAAIFAVGIEDKNLARL